MQNKVQRAKATIYKSVKIFPSGKHRNIFSKLSTTKVRFDIFSKSKEAMLSSQSTSMNKFFIIFNTVE